MPAPDRISAGVWLALAVTVVLDCVVQILWKTQAAALPDGDQPALLLRAAAHQPGVWCLLAILLLQLVLWRSVLRRAPLSLVQPMTSLSYPGVGVLSWAWLGESWTLRQMLSVALILIGVWLVSGAPAAAQRGDQAP